MTTGMGSVTLAGELGRNTEIGSVGAGLLCAGGAADAEAAVLVVDGVAIAGAIFAGSPGWPTVGPSRRFTAAALGWTG